MAQALRTVWLEPEEQNETLAPKLQPRQRKRQLLTMRQSPLTVLSMVAVVALAVGLVAAFIYSNARLARYDFQRQALDAEMRQLQSKCAQLRLDVAHLENTSEISVAIQQQQMAFPDANRVHYLHVAKDLPPTPTTKTAAKSGQQSWIAQTGSRVIAGLDNVLQRLSHGPGVPAYAQE